MAIRRSIWEWGSWLLVLGGICMTTWGFLGTAGVVKTSNGIDDWTPTDFKGVGIPMIGIGLLFVFMTSAAREYRAKGEHLRKLGIEGMARVISVVERGGSHNYKPRWTVELEIELPGKPAYVTQKNVSQDGHLIARFTAGSKWPVRVSPTDPNHLSVAGMNADPEG